MEIKEGLDQAATELAESGTVGGGEGGDAIVKTEGSLTQDGTGSDLGVDQVPEQLKEKEKELLRAFHSKTQALSEKERGLEQYVKDAKSFYGLADQQWFKQAVESEKARRAGLDNITDEAFESLKSDKRAFGEYLANREKSIVERVMSQFKPELDKLGKSQEELHANREFEGVSGKYGQAFKDANETGQLDSYLQKGLDYETAFILHEQAHGRVAGKKPVAPVDRRGSVVDKGGMSTVRGGPVSKAKNLDDYLNVALDLIGRGSKDYRIVKE